MNEYATRYDYNIYTLKIFIWICENTQLLKKIILNFSSYMF